MKTSLDLEGAFVLQKYLLLWYAYMVSLAFGGGELVRLILDGQPVTDNTVASGMIFAFLVLFSAGGLWFTFSLFKEGAT